MKQTRTRKKRKEERSPCRSAADLQQLTYKRGDGGRERERERESGRGEGREEEEDRGWRIGNDQRGGERPPEDATTTKGMPRSGKTEPLGKGGTGGAGGVGGLGTVGGCGYHQGCAQQW
uniref:Uncharacterized protein n=1 Tax=Oryza punctata TaxID=4537 RepID=A0A0E0KLZ8_ORYPU